MFWDVGKVSGNHAVWAEASTTYAREQIPDEPEPEEPVEPEDESDPSTSVEPDPSDTTSPEPEEPSNASQPDASDASDTEEGGCQAAQGESLWTLLIFMGLFKYRRRYQPTICEALH